MTLSAKLHDQAAAAFRKAQRKEDGIAAWSDHQVASQAVRDKTARLRALRLAKEVADKAAEVDIGKPAPRRRRRQPPELRRLPGLRDAKPAQVAAASATGFNC